MSNEITCPTCQGKGLVGQGEKGWMQLGQLKTCKSCSGTGKAPEMDIPSKKQKNPGLTEGGDEVPPEEPKDEGIIKRIFG